MRRIAIDFDGTLAEKRFPAVGRIKPGAREALERFRALGYYIVIFSCRTGSWDPEMFGQPGSPEHQRHRDGMQAVLDAAGVPYDEIDDGSRGKVYADFYIDDKALRFEDNWPEIVELVSAFRQVEVLRSP